VLLAAITAELIAAALLPDAARTAKGSSTISHADHNWLQRFRWDRFGPVAT